MTFLIVEDDEYKLRQIVNWLRMNWADVDFREVRSVNAAKRLLREITFDLVLLDMSLPTYSIGNDESGGRPQGFGGREVLRFAQRLDVGIRVIVITQFVQFKLGTGEEVDIATLANQLNEEFPNLFVGLVYYNTTSNGWQTELESLLEKIALHGGSE